MHLSTSHFLSFALLILSRSVESSHSSFGHSHARRSLSLKRELSPPQDLAFVPAGPTDSSKGSNTGTTALLPAVSTSVSSTTTTTSGGLGATSDTVTTSIPTTNPPSTSPSSTATSTSPTTLSSKTLTTLSTTSSSPGLSGGLSSLQSTLSGDASTITSSSLLGSSSTGSLADSTSTDSTSLSTPLGHSIDTSTTTDSSSSTSKSALHSTDTDSSLTGVTTNSVTTSGSSTDTSSQIGPSTLTTTSKATPTAIAPSTLTESPSTASSSTSITSSTGCSGIGCLLSSILHPPSSSPSDTEPTASSGDTSDILPGTLTSSPTSSTSRLVPSIISLVSSQVSSVVGASSDSGTSTTTTSPPPVGGSTSVPTDTSSSTQVSQTSSGGTIISLSSSVSNSISTGSSTTGIATTSSPTPVSITIAPGFSFLTQSTLEFTSVSSSLAVATLTNPDQPTTTLSLDVSGTALPSQAPLPTGAPARIYPQNGIDPSSANLTGFTFISILFNQELNWLFVTTNPVSSSQIFAFFPPVITTALGISPDQVQTFALQVWKPSTYTGPSDAEQLGTVWLAYIPSDLVDTLAAQIKAKQSPFYTGTTGISAELAARVDSAFNLNSVPNPDSGISSNNSPLASTSGETSEERTRQDAIIGVVSALGAFALIILVILIYRSFKRRQELGHHRLSGQDHFTGQRPEGREFDEDSVGGQRRRSFYYAEDSLRGFQGERQEQPTSDSHIIPSQMSQRRVMPAAISAPVLTESSMNW